MSSSPTLSDPTNDASPAPVSQRDEDAQYYRQVLHELVEIGSRLARAIDRQATSAPNAAPEQAAQPAPAAAPAAAPELSIAFDRVARTIALARKLAEPAPQARAAEQAHQRRTAARKQIIRDLAETEALHAELYERLDTLDLDDDIDTLPIPEIIAAIRRDLGLDPHRTTRGISPWKRRRPQDVRALCARAARPSVKQPRTGHPLPIPAPPPRARPGTGPPAP